MFISMGDLPFSKEKQGWVERCDNGREGAVSGGDEGWETGGNVK